MESRPVGTSPLTVSAIGLGCNNFSRPATATETLEGSIRVIHAAIDAGVTFLDGADIYGGAPGRSESFLGEALQGGRRDKVVLATKFGHSQVDMPGTEGWGNKGGRTYIRGAVEASLSRLRTDRIDLLQMHTPDPDTPIGETLAALTELVEEGKVRFVGNSNFSAEQLRHADAVSRENGFVRFVSAQNQYSLLAREIEADVLPAAVELGLGVFPFFPLHHGALTGKYTREGGTGRLQKRPEVFVAIDWEAVEAFRSLCDQAHLPMVAVSIRWLLSRAGIASVIAGATTPEQVAANVAAGSTDVPADVLDAVDAVFAPTRDRTAGRA